MKRLALASSLTVSGCAHAALAHAPDEPKPVVQPARQTRREHCQVPTPRRIAEFNERVTSYAQLHQQLEATLPPLPKETTPEVIDTHQRALEHLIGPSAGTPKQGDIFTPRRPRSCSADLRPGIQRPGRAGAARPRSWTRTPAGCRLAVNARYPDAIPAVDGAAAGAGVAAQAPRGARVPLHRRTAGPARRSRPHHRRLHGQRLPAVDAGSFACASLDPPSSASSSLPAACAQPQRGPVQVAAAGHSAAGRQGTCHCRAAQSRRLAEVRRARRLRRRRAGSCSWRRTDGAASMQRFPFELVITVGDNIYGSRAAAGLRAGSSKTPYKPLLDAGVKFYASLGNHDDRASSAYYKLFNMDGKLYYTFKAPKQNVRFFALESDYLDAGSRSRGCEGTRSVGRGLEDPVLPSPAVFIGRAARLTSRRAARCSSRCS